MVFMELSIHQIYNRHKLLIDQYEVNTMKEDVVRYEKILNETSEIVEKMNALLDQLEANSAEYNALKDYYGSEEYMHDVDLSNESDTYQDISTGVLFEDGVYNLIAEQYALNIRMLEIATQQLKTH